MTGFSKRFIDGLRRAEEATEADARTNVSEYPSRAGPRLVWRSLDRTPPQGVEVERRPTEISLGMVTEAAMRIVVGRLVFLDVRQIEHRTRLEQEHGYPEIGQHLRHGSAAGTRAITTTSCTSGFREV